MEGGYGTGTLDGRAMSERKNHKAFEHTRANIYPQAVKKDDVDLGYISPTSYSERKRSLSQVNSSSDESLHAREPDLGQSFKRKRLGDSRGSDVLDAGFEALLGLQAEDGLGDKGEHLHSRDTWFATYVLRVRSKIW